jgi:hypothetical protein
MPKKAYTTFAFSFGGSIVVVSENDFYADNHEYVLLWPAFFADVFTLVPVIPNPP